MTMLLLHKSATLLLQFQMEEKAVIGNFSIYITQHLTIACCTQHSLTCWLWHCLMHILHEEFQMAADYLMSFCTFQILYPVLGNVSKMVTPFQIRSPKIKTVWQLSVQILQGSTTRIVIDTTYSSSEQGDVMHFCYVFIAYHRFLSMYESLCSLHVYTGFERRHTSCCKGFFLVCKIDKRVKTKNKISICFLENYKRRTITVLKGLI